MAILRYVELAVTRLEEALETMSTLSSKHRFSQLVVGLQEPTPSKCLRSLFARFVIGCIVDRTEDAVLNKYRSSMPAEFDDPFMLITKTLWLRYERCQIAIYADVVSAEIWKTLRKEPTAVLVQFETRKLNRSNTPDAIRSMRMITEFGRFINLPSKSLLCSPRH